MNSQDRAAILSAVDTVFDDEIAFLEELSGHQSTRGNEQSAQRFYASELKRRGYSVDVWNVEIDDICNIPGFSPVIGGYEDALNVVGTRASRTKRGRSLILNGHIDVVPEGPHQMWRSPPFEPRIDGDWMYGRGTGDMKAGLAANIFALDALNYLGLAPAANVYVQSVVEEECTGNGALACIQRGYAADVAFIPEPMAEELVSAQVGVIWMQVCLKGKSAHAAYAESGSNAIEAAIPLINALRKLEARWNATDRRHVLYSHVDNPLKLNIGRIQGGDWTSSVPAWCNFEVRMGIFPGQDVEIARQELEQTLREASDEHPYLRDNHPEFIYHGFCSKGYSLAEDNSPGSREAIESLAGAHQAVTGAALGRVPITATTDGRMFGLYADTPTLVYGPKAESIHGFDERVDLVSLRRVTQTMALFIADRCGLERL